MDEDLDMAEDVANIAPKIITAASWHPEI